MGSRGSFGRTTGRVWLRRWIRRAFGRVVAWALSIGVRPQLPGEAQKIQRLLVLRIDERVGNVLLTIPLLDKLVQALPEARVRALVARSKSRLLEGTVETIPFDKRTLFVRPWSFLSLIFRLRRERYDVVIDGSHWHHFSLSSAMLLLWTGAPVRIAHDRGDAARFANVLVARPGREPETLSKMRLLEPLGFEASLEGMQTTLGASGVEKDTMAAWLQSRGLQERVVVGLYPGARKANHRLPTKLFARLGAVALEAGAEVLLLWGPSEEALVKEVQGQLDASVIAPPTDLAALAALLRHCRVVVAHDTGPMHLCVACGTPTVGLFLNSDVQRWGHDRAPHRAITATERPLDEVFADARRALIGGIRSGNAQRDDLGTESV